MTWQIISAIAGIGILVLAFLVTHHRRRSELLGARLAQAQERLAVAPFGALTLVDGYWHPNASAQELLALDSAEAKTLEQVIALFEVTPNDPLEIRLDLLLSEDRAFERSIGAAHDGKTLWINGISHENAVVLWMRDDSASAWLVEQFSKKEDTVRLLTSVLDTLPFPIWWRRGEDLAIMGANTAFSEMSGQAQPEDPENAQSPNDRSRDLARLAQRTSMAQTESKHVVIEGDRRTLDITEAPLVYHTGMIAGFGQDVTALENLQMTLAEHIALQDQVLERLSSAIATFGPDRRLKFFNAPFAHMWELEASVLDEQPAIGTLMEMLRSARQLPEMSDFPAYKRQTEALFTTLIDPREELMHLPDGRTVRSVASPHPLGGLIFQYEDVTDRLALESSHNTLTAVQRSTMNSLFEGVCVFARDGRMKLFNSVYAEMFELDAEWLATEPHVSEVADAARSLLTVEDALWDDLKRRLITFISEPKSRQGRMVLSDDRVLDYAYVPLPDSQCLVLYLDVTDTTQVEAALRERNRALENADLLKSQFISNVSYELRTPLNAIMGFTELLKLGGVGTLNQRQVLYIENIFSASQDLSDLVGDILDLAAVQAGFMAFTPQDYDIRQAMVDARDFQSEEAQQRLSITLPDETLLANLDPRRTQQALRLALADALRYSPNSIRVRAEKKEGHPILRIAPGTAEQDQIPWVHHALGQLHNMSVDQSISNSSDIGISLARSIFQAQSAQLYGDGDDLIIQFPKT